MSSLPKYQRFIGRLLTQTLAVSLSFSMTFGTFGGYELSIQSAQAATKQEVDGAKAEMQQAERDLKSQESELKEKKSELKAVERSMDDGDNANCSLCRPSCTAGCTDEFVATLTIAKDANQMRAFRSGSVDSCTLIYEEKGESIPSACKAQVLKCTSVAKARRKKQLERDIKELTDSIKDTKKELSVKREAYNSANGDCADCALEAQKAQMRAMYREPSTGELIVAGIGAATPLLMGGLGAYMGIRGMNQYTGMYNNYLNTCSTMGIPCSAPGMGGMGMAGMMGGMGMGMYGMGGLGMLGMGMGGGSLLGGIVGGIGGGIPGFGMMGMGMPGMGMYGNALVGGVVGGIGGGFPGYGMGMMGMGMPGMGMYGMGMGGLGMPGFGMPGMGMYGNSLVGGVVGGIGGGMGGLGMPGMGMYGMGFPGMGMAGMGALGMGGVGMMGAPGMMGSLFPSGSMTGGWAMPNTGWGTGFNSGLFPNGNSQYGNLYNQSMQYAMQQAQRQQSDLMLAQQQAWEAQQRVGQIMSSGAGYGGGGIGFGNIGGSFGGSFGVGAAGFMGYGLGTGGGMRSF